MTIGVATLTPWQHSSPTGGLITTQRVLAEDLRPGMVARTAHTPMWQAITTIEYRLHVGLIVTYEDDHREWIGAWSGLEIRQDCFWEPAVIAACGCWDTSYLEHGGVWRCDQHLTEGRRVG